MCLDSDELIGRYRKEFASLFVSVSCQGEYLSCKSRKFKKLCSNLEGKSLQALVPRKYSLKVIRHKPPLPGLLVHALPDLNHNRIDDNTKPMEHWCIATVALSSGYFMMS